MSAQPVAAAADVSSRRAERERRQRRPAVLRVVGGTLVVVLLVGLASVAWWPLYRSSAMVGAGVAAVVAGALIALAGSWWRLPGPVLLALTVAAFTLVGVPAAVPTEAAGVLPTPAGLVDLFSSVALGWKRLLTIGPPVGDYEALLVPYFASALVVVVVGVTIALRTPRPEIAALPPLAFFAVGVLVGPTRLAYPVVSGVVLVGAALAWALVSRRVRRAVAVAGTAGSRVHVGRSIVRPSLVGLATIVAAGVLASGLGVVATPHADRRVARSSVVAPFDPRDYVSPLSGFRAYEEAGTADAPQLTVTGLPADGFVRIATLDTYDGVVYSVGGPSGASASGTFSRVPTSVDTSGVRGRRVHVDVHVRGYGGVWVPTVGDLEQIRFTGSHADAERNAFYYDRSTGTAAVVGGVGRGTAYSLTAVVPTRPSAGELAGARPGAARVPTPTQVPEAVSDTVAATTKGVTGTGRKLAAVIAALRTHGYVSHGVGDDRPSRSGHGADRITELLTAPLMIGDGEQYAVAASLMAQDLGFPARVVLGFASGGSGADGVDTGRTTFRGADVTARIEVDTAQYGWVMIDPNPPVRAIPEDQDQTPQPVTRPETVVPPPPAAQEDQDTQTPPQSDRGTPPEAPLWLRILLAALPWVIGALAVAALVALPFAVVVARKRLRRRRRRRAPTGRARVVGAWDEYRDALTDRGVPIGRAATRRDVAGMAPDPAAAGLAALADRVVFGPADADGATADRMWSATDTAVRALQDGRTRWQRFRAATSLRSLRRPRSPRASAPARSSSTPGSAG
ncbi:transglutaminase domain-containing protein [Curtobacterium sp. MCBD17_028]|uniref:DUF3488 and transglutaminase-like domain-containing protein n=1 Tax=Curtobacterium sp. MCBD17_028 TaxID=2175670 RepID=UPI000DA91336|nr:transglutaminase domain-containing protein [Curtobacterium sp. MCBD17_028]PZE28851.1 transglutaminase domain-containing protein [Curtobacterium sp. MCBD17_028]